jgi:hypothetical protein
MLQGTLQDIFSRKSYQINCYLELRAQLCLSANLLGVVETPATILLINRIQNTSNFPKIGKIHFSSLG